MLIFETKVSRLQEISLSMCNAAKPGKPERQDMNSVQSTKNIQFSLHMLSLIIDAIDTCMVTGQVTLDIVDIDKVDFH